MKRNINAIDSGLEGTFIDFAESAVEEVAVWAAEYVDTVAKALMPDNRGFGKRKLSEKEQMEAYQKNLRGNEAAWTQWITDRVSAIRNQLTQSGLSEADIAAAHPYDVVESFAIRYSSRMERLLKEEDTKRRPPAPLLPPTESESYVPSLPPAMAEDDIGDIP